MGNWTFLLRDISGILNAMESKIGLITLLLFCQLSCVKCQIKYKQLNCPICTLC
jgi:hypothetical protein